FDGAALDGATRKIGGKYVSADGRAAYSFSGDPTEGGTLTVNFYATGNAGQSAAPTNSVKIKDWKNGDLGITLGDGTTGALAASDAPATSNDTTSNAPAESASDGAQNDGTTAANIDPTSSIDLADLAPPPGTATNENALDPTESQSMSTDAIGRVSEPPDVGGTLVDPGTVDQAVRAFATVPEAPDVTAAIHAADASAIGVTPQDLSNAMLDFHDSSDLVHDQAGSEPLPAPMPTLTTPS